MIGFGSIGKGMLPLIERHFELDMNRFTVIDPNDKGRSMLDARGITFVSKGLTPENYREILTPLLTEGGGQGFRVNLSVDTSSRDIMECCRENGALYIDTVAEPWAGFYFDKTPGLSLAPTTPCARSSWTPATGTPAARRRCPVAALIPAWCPGSSNRLCSTLPRI